MYETTHTIDGTAFDCLYDMIAMEDVTDITNKHGANAYIEFVRYCRRPSATTNKASLFNENPRIINGKVSTFDDLRTMGITSQQLFKWFAPIDVIEEYESGKENGFFVNCSDRSSLWFGTHCQYTFDSDRGLSNILETRFHAKKHVPDNLLSITNGTCLQIIGVDCQSIICLDWREICDGKIDCTNGFDEQHCFELEQNECDRETEYRCRNGLCIDKGFYWDEKPDCMDQSDETHLDNQLCFAQNNRNCEDKSCPPLSFSCGDGICSNGPTKNLNSCKSQRDRFYFEQIGESKLILFSQLILILNETIFESICFNETLCPLLYHHNSTFLLNNFKCRLLNTLLNQTFFHFDDILKHIKRFLRSCFVLPNQSLLNNQSTLFQCDDKTKFISRHRLYDGHEDCANGEDEHPAVACAFNLPYRLTCDNGTRCFPVTMLQDKIRNCDDGYDEDFMNNLCSDISSAECRAHRDESNKFNLNFGQICNRIVERVPDANNDTDESDCQITEWPCQTTYSRCNGVWNCPDGSDELSCDESILTNRCNHTKHFCLDENTGYPICLSLDQAGDSTIQCVGSTDERAFCRLKYPYEYARRYRCRNADLCITPFQVCDCHKDCPSNDDESIACDWLNNGEEAFCSDRQFRCRDGKYFNESLIDCNHNNECSDGEDELFCDLIDRSLTQRFYWSQIEVSPLTTTNNGRTWNPLVNNDFIIWHCNRGVYIRSIANPPGFFCLCPNYFYGDRCQFQRKRLSFVLRLQTTSLLDDNLSTFKLVIFLVRHSTSIRILSHEQFVYIPQRHCLPHYSIELVYPIDESIDLSFNHSVYIDVFVAETLVHWISWKFPISFEFLPVNRMVKQLIIPDININYGTNQMTMSKTNCSSCSNVYRCLGYDLDLGREICLCPLNRTGRRCLIPFDPCTENSCSGHGQCRPLDARHAVTKAFQCFCLPEWFGEQCDQRKARIYLSISPKIVFPSSSIALIHIIYRGFFYSPRQLIYLIRLNEGQSNLTFYVSISEEIPQIAFIQLYEHSNKSDLYLLLLLNESLPSLREINTKIDSSRRCRSIKELFDLNVLNQSPLRRVKNYQRLCLDRGNQLKCFYDEKLMCLCDTRNHSICFDFDSVYSGCSLNDCNGRGMCIQDHQICPKNSTCICEKCSYGAGCQLSTAGYTLSLDAILGSHFRPNTINIFRQTTVIKISITIISLLIFFGTIVNIFAIITFTQRSTKTSGSRLYLFVSSVVGIFSLMMLLGKIIVLYIGKQNSIVCALVEFTLKFFPAYCEWLNGCVAIERMMAVKQATNFSMVKSKRFAKYVVLGLAMLISLICSFELIFRRVLINTLDGQSWCVLTLSTNRTALLSIYSTLNVLLFLVPMIINFTSSVIIIISTLRRKQQIFSIIVPGEKKKKKLQWKNVKTQIVKHKHILVAPALMGVLAMPRVILTFVYVCTKVDRRPFLHLTGYLVGFLPSMGVFFAFILPAETYRTAFVKSIQRIKNSCIHGGN